MTRNLQLRLPDKNLLDELHELLAMNNLLILIPVALGLGIVGLFAFIWSLKSGQFDDLDGAAERILENDPREQQEE